MKKELITTGKLEWFFEQGCIMVSLLLYRDGHSGYDALFEINEEHYIEIFNHKNKLVYEGEIIKDDFTGWKTAYNSNRGGLTSNGSQVEWLQYGVDPDIWGGYFSKSYRAKLYKSNLTKKQKEKLKKKSIKKLEKKYNEDKEYEETLLNKTRICLENKEDLYKELNHSEKRYQMFDGNYHTLFIESYKKEEYIGEKLDKIKKIKKSDSALIDINMPEEFEKIRKFNKFKNRHEVVLLFIKKTEMAKAGISRKDIFKFETKFLKLEKESKKARKIIERELYKKINKVTPRILIEEKETINEYIKEVSVIKILSFPKKITKYFDPNFIF